MRQVPDWPEYYLGLARQVATRSKDPNTQVGAVIVNPNNRVIGIGYNGFPENAMEDRVLWSDERKADMVIHAEVNAIGNAARSGSSTQDATVYLTLVPCLNCALTLAAAGVTEVYWPRADYEARIAAKPEREALYAKAMQMFDASGILWSMV